MEVLVAIMVLAISMTVIMQLFSGGLRSERLSEDYLQAIYLARAKMEEMLLEKEMSEEIREGTFSERYRWRAVITLTEPENVQKEKDPVLKAEKVPVLFRIDLDVFWPQGQRNRHFNLSTLHLAENITDTSK